MKPTSPSERLAYCTVRIETTLRHGGTATGTGFFFKFSETGNGFAPVLVTNKHVLDGAARTVFVMHGSDPGAGPDRTRTTRVELENVRAITVNHPDPDVDLCAFPVGPLVTAMQRQGRHAFYIMLDRNLVADSSFLEQLTHVEDILMVGYPKGIWDDHNNMPIMRRGITATHPALDYRGKQEFLIDAACFPGSSGSPVLLWNPSGYASKSGAPVIGSRIKLLGVLFAGPQFTAIGNVETIEVPAAYATVALTRVPNSLGVVLKASRIVELDAEFGRIHPPSQSA